MLPDHEYGASVSRGVSVYLRKTSLMGYYSFNRPRRDGWLSWPCWLTDSGRFTHKVVTRPAISVAQDGECSSARTGVLTTMLRHQLANLTLTLLTLILRLEWQTFGMAGQHHLLTFLSLTVSNKYGLYR